MNYLDLIISIPLVWGAFNGFRKGLVIEIASLVGLIGGIYGSIKFSAYTGDFLRNYVDWSDNLIRMTAFTLTFIVIVLLVHLLAKLIQKLVNIVALGIPNRILGAIFGMIKYLLIVSALLYIVNSIDNRYEFVDEKLKESSFLYMPVSGIIPLVYPAIKTEFDDNL